MLTLTLAGNNLESNSQCRCSVVANGATIPIYRYKIYVLYSRIKTPIFTFNLHREPLLP